MPWTERQVAMLAEMGLRIAPQPAGNPGEARDRAEHDEAQAATAESGLASRPALHDSSTRPEPAFKPHAVSAHDASAAFVRAPSSAPPAVVARGDRPRGVESMDWPALREAVAACTACKLCETRRQTVFGVGHARAHWMIVGEAPGEQEDAQGEPFVGKSGQLLDNMLRALGVSRHATSAPGNESAATDPARQVYIANTLKCRPPGNRNPTPAELAQCEPFLVRQVALVQPRVILAMGRFAVQSLLRSDEPVGRLRGRVHHYEGVPLIVTYHPAYLLRNPEDKARAWDDLCLAAETMAASEGAA